MKISIQKRIMPNIQLTPNVRRLCQIFGLTKDDINNPLLDFNIRLNIKNGDIVFITGPSGCGKSVLLAEITAAIQADRKVDISHIPTPAAGAVIDRFRSAPAGLRALSYMGLSDVAAMLLPPSLLSEGQKYRYRFARSLDLGRRFIIADEFCSSLDKVTAGILCMKLRQIADKTGLVFILAGHTRSILPDLLPDTVLKVHSDGLIHKLIRQTDTDLYEKA